MASDSDQNPTVFIVDDEFAVRDALRLVIETMGFDVKCFSSAMEFMEFIEPYDDSGPVCLVVDIQMPQIGGIELLQQLSKLDKEFPVIMITGHGSTELKHIAEELGAVGFLEKPFRPNHFQDIITTILRKNAGEQETPATSE